MLSAAGLDDAVLVDGDDADRCIVQDVSEPLATLSYLSDHGAADDEDERASRPDDGDDDGADDARGPQEGRPDFGQIDLDHYAQVQLRHWLIGRQHLDAPVIARDDRSRLAGKRPPHRLGET